MEIEPKSIFGSSRTIASTPDMRAVVTRPASSAKLLGSDRPRRKNCGRGFCAAREGMAVLHEADEWGERWRVDVAMLRQNRRVVVRAIWIVRKGSPNPRFVTCWVLR